jgi:hypothetical protein
LERGVEKVFGRLPVMLHRLSLLISHTPNEMRFGASGRAAFREGRVEPGGADPAYFAMVRAATTQ